MFAIELIDRTEPLEPFCGFIVILPEFGPPIISCCALVVERFPVLVKKAPPDNPAESVATGIPPATLSTANFDDVDAVPPIAKS